MKFNVLTIMPNLIEQGLSEGLVGQAFQKDICHLNLVNPRNFTTDKHQSVDDRPFGGGDGMLMMAEPLDQALKTVEEPGEVFYMSPQGQIFDDSMALELSTKKSMTLICGRYAGVDQRFLVKNKIREISIGNYVLSGGELPALVVMDSVVRKIPGVLGHIDSAAKDSFAMKGLLEAPSFTRPQEFLSLSVPEILLSGDHKKITEYREQMSILVTLQKKPELMIDKNIDFKKVKFFLSEMSDQDFKVSGLDPQILSEKIEELKG